MMQELQNDTFKERPVDLFHEIAHCPNIQYCYDTRQGSHPCSKIISVQRSYDSHILAHHQVPEPWVGDLEHAPILFLSSNPSLDEEEKFPRWSWREEQTADFFINRFEQWIEEGVRRLMPDGSLKAVPFWVEVRQRAIELRGQGVRPGIDYALTEVVHCKSKREEGVKEALRECAGRFLRRVLELSGAKVIVVLGSKAEDAMRREFSIPDGSVVGPQPIGNHQRYIVFLYHPSYCRRPHRKYRKPCTFEECLDEKLQELRAFLQR
jgi:Uracil DNA glycosylase superfamily